MTSISDTEVVNAPGGLVELGYVEKTTNVTVTATTSGSANSVIGPLTVVCDGSPVLVEMYSWGVFPNTSTANPWISLGMKYDGTRQNGHFGYYQQQGTGYGIVPVYIARRFTPSSGSHTFEIDAYVNTGTGAVLGDTGGNPMYLRVSKILQASQLLVTQSNAPTVTDLPSNPVINQEVHHLVNNSYFDKKYNGSTWVNINEQPSVEIVAGAGQTGFVVDTWTKLTFPSATVTNNFGFTISNGIITIPSNLGGLYHVSGQCQWDANNSGIRLLSFAESGNYNGTVLSGPTVPSASYMRTPVSGLIRLTGGQSYCLWGINSGSGGTRDLIITFLTQRFNIARVSS